MIRMKRLFYTLLIIGLCSTMTFLSSCKDNLVYDQYIHTPISGWEKNDTLSFDIAPFDSTGAYEEQLGLRITGAYPFMSLTLIVEQSIYPNKSKKDKIEKVDTIQCNLIDNNGITRGQGISYYQYNFPINIYQFHKNDSIHITIRHDMKREILPGISDIGIKVQHFKLTREYKEMLDQKAEERKRSES